MKKITVLISLILCIALFGCGESQQTAEATDIPEATPTASPEYAEITPDPSVPEGNVKYQYEELYFYIPEDYIEGMQDVFPLLYTAAYPDVQDCIMFNATFATKISEYGKNSVAAKLKTEVEGYQKLVSYEKIKLAGAETVKVVFTIKQDDLTFNETQYYIFATDHTYIISIADFSGTNTKAMQAVVQTAFKETT